MRRLILIVFYVLLAIPVSGQVEFRRGRADAPLREMYKLREPATEFVEFMLDGHMDESCVVAERLYNNDPATVLCAFEDRYRDVQTLYIEATKRDIMLLLDNQVVAFSPAWHITSYLIVVDIPPGEYTVFLHSAYSGADPEEIVYTFEISDEVSSEILEAP